MTLRSSGWSSVGSSRLEIGTALQEGVESHSSWMMIAETISSGKNGFHEIAIERNFETVGIVTESVCEKAVYSPFRGELKLFEK